MANTTTSYFTSNKFDITEWTALLTLWTSFMIDGLTTTFLKFCDWLEGQMMEQMGDLHEPNRVYLDPEPEPVTPTADNDLDAILDHIDKIETGEIVIEVSDNPGCEVTMISPEPVTKVSELTYKDLQRLLREYRDQWGDIQCKLNAKRDTLESEVQRLKLIA